MDRPTRALSLKRESLVELTATDLAGLAGGAPAAPPTMPVRDCLGGISDEHTCVDCLTRWC